jgi:hypothetical protein
MRLVQMWVPDVRSRAFKRDAHRESLAVARSANERRDQAFVDAVSVWPGEE